MRLLSLVALATQFGLLASAQPILGFPFDQQLPNVARVGESYDFVLNADTFKSDAGSVVYSASNLPSWLQFDPNSLSFSGTPQQAQNVTFTLSGNDSTGSVSEDCFLIVTQDPGPVLKSEDYLYQQLAKSGRTNGYDGVVLKPLQDFTIKFDNDTFQMGSGSNNSIVAYYGRSQNMTSLPIWLQFDEDTLTFSGTAPAVNALNAPSQQFDITLIATDYVGYAAAYGSFNIVVGGHYLISDVDGPLVINGTAGMNISEKIPLDSVYLDGEKIAAANVSSVKLYEGPDWISIDNQVLVGTIPKDVDSNSELNVTVTDVYGDAVFISFEVDVLNTVFTVKSLPDVNATRGDFFEYSVDRTELTDSNDTVLSASYDNADWLKFYYTNQTFNGWVPEDFESVDVTLNGTMGSLYGSEKFAIKGIDDATKTSSSLTSSSATPTPTSSSSASSTPTPATSHHKSLDNKKKLAIGLGVGIPVAAIILAALIFICCWRRRKATAKEDEEEKNKRDGPLLPVGPLNKKQSNVTLKSGDDGTQDVSDKNLMKLDGNSVSSGSSSVTNVDSVENQKPLGPTDPYGPDASGSGSSGSQGVAAAGVRNSWRKSNSKSANWKPRDSLTSLATVTTNDLLTMNVIDDPSLQRRSQMNLLLRRNSNNNNLNGNNLSNTNLIPSYTNSRVASMALSNANGNGVSNSASKLRRDNSSGYYSSDPSSNIELLDSGSSSGSNSKHNIPAFHDAVYSPEQKLTPIRDFSSNSASTGSAKLVDFQDKASVEETKATLANDKKSYRGVIEDELPHSQSQ
ncbi:DEKNAAC101937 [Brettanomyces naardenensis]|uniref:DEKNAAC101937 n=1 Tax=Brettanomyces naardenensis TaxID=13370 RepID=A0A448YJI7_BRENA|nr:DEKNAAC101937 [Brettanomyces naardenensis]